MNAQLHTPQAATGLSRRPWGLMMLAALVGMSMLLASGSALAEPKPTDWSAKDVKGRSVSTDKYRGKVTMVIINSPDKRDAVKPLSKKLTLRYGDNNKVDQITIVDLTDAPMTWSAAEAATGKVTSEIAKTHDRTVKRINGWLKEAGKKPIRGLDRKMHIVLDWDGKIIKKYKYWDTKKFITVVVVNQHGDPIGSFKGNQLDKLMKAVDAAVGELE